MSAYDTLVLVNLAPQDDLDFKEYDYLCVMAKLLGDLTVKKTDIAFIRDYREDKFIDQRDDDLELDDVKKLIFVNFPKDIVTEYKDKFTVEEIEVNLHAKRDIQSYLFYVMEDLFKNYSSIFLPSRLSLLQDQIFNNKYPYEFFFPNLILELVTQTNNLKAQIYNHPLITEDQQWVFGKILDWVYDYFKVLIEPATIVKIHECLNNLDNSSSLYKTLFTSLSRVSDVKNEYLFYKILEKAYKLNVKNLKYGKDMNYKVIANAIFTNIYIAAVTDKTNILDTTKLSPPLGYTLFFAYLNIGLIEGYYNVKVTWKKDHNRILVNYTIKCEPKDLNNYMDYVLVDIDSKNVKHSGCKYSITCEVQDGSNNKLHGEVKKKRKGRGTKLSDDTQG